MAGRLVNADGVTPMRRSMSAPGGTAHHAADPFSREMFTWTPPLLSADRAWLRERDPSIARLRDILRNVPEARAALKTYTDHTIGSGLRLKLTPRHRPLGIAFEAANEWARMVEAEWAAEAADPLKFSDLSRSHSEGEMQRIAFQDWVATGDALALIQWRERGGRSATCYQLVDPDRLSNPLGEGTNDRLRGGVEMDADGAPVAYHFRRAHASDGAIGARPLEWERIEATTDWGRPQVVHHFVADRADQRRGEPALLATVKLLRMGSKMTDTELAAGVISSMLMGAIESPFDHSTARDLLAEDNQLSAYQGNRTAFHDQRAISFGGLRMPTLFPGEKLHLFQNQRVQGVLDAFIGLVRPAADRIAWRGDAGTDHARLQQGELLFAACCDRRRLERADRRPGAVRRRVLHAAIPRMARGEGYDRRAAAARWGQRLLRRLSASGRLCLARAGPRCRRPDQGSPGSADAHGRHDFDPRRRSGGDGLGLGGCAGAAGAGDRQDARVGHSGAAVGHGDALPRAGRG